MNQFWSLLVKALDSNLWQGIVKLVKLCSHIYLHWIWLWWNFNWSGTNWQILLICVHLYTWLKKKEEEGKRHAGDTFVKTDVIYFRYRFNHKHMGGIKYYKYWILHSKTLTCYNLFQTLLPELLGLPPVPKSPWG